MLVDVSEVAGEAGFVFPAAITAAVEGDLRRQGDYDGRLWDLLFMAARAARRGGTEPIIYRLILPVGRARSYDAKLHLGGGDQGEPVVTIMQPRED